MKKITQCFTVLVFYFCGSGYAQFTNVWDASYQHTATTTFSNESRKVAVDVSGNIFVLADATSDLDLNNVVDGSTHHYTVLLKYSTNGVLLEDTIIEIRNHLVSGFDNKSAFGLEIDNSGDIYIGYSAYDASNDFDVVLSKYTNNLSPVWEYRFSTPDEDAGVDMKLAPQGNAYAIVKTTSGANTQYHIIKANSQKITSIPYYSFDMNQDYLSSMAIGNFQYVYVTGYSLISGVKNLLTAKVGLGGSLKWSKTFDGGSVADDDYGTHITYGIDSSIYVTGSSYRSAGNGFDVVTIKYLPRTGRKDWVSYNDYGTSDEGRFVFCVDTANVYVGAISGNEVLIDEYDVFTGHITSSGIYAPLPVANFTTLDGVSLTDMKISFDKNFYLTGNILATNASGFSFSASFLAKYYLTPNNLIDMDFEYPVEGNFSQSYSAAGLFIDNTKQDVYWLRSVYSNFSNHNQESILLNDFDVPPPVRSAKPQGIAGDEISVFPNPSNEFFNISSTKEIVKIEITDCTGKIVKTFTVNSKNPKVEISGLITGMYLARLYSTTGDILTEKIVVN